MGAWFRQTLTVTRKELRGYFGSPLAFIFIGAFLAVTLFSFFWVETFFARGIADVRPLFSWMPVLMIFLVAALTMRQWSEEQRSGTLEILLTLPVSTVQLVLGKFLAVLAQVALALALTIFLPLTVSLLGNLDWGPVFGGYLAAILLAGAYAAIGLFVSSRTDNQIVALISTVLLCGLLYLVGSAGVTDFFGNQAGEILRAIGAGSRFESIERGVIDLRDLVYYLSVAGIFLALNVLSLKAKGWSEGEQTLPKRRGVALTSGLLIVNLLVVNVWMFPLSRLRVDMTEFNEYTLSPTTRELVSTLQEPLLIRGYFSEKTHPLLAPLVPTVRDMLNEYRVASNGMIELEIIDPAEEPEREAEANQVYGIRPTPFQVADRYEASVINSYFDILIQYGDQSEVLGFGDLIEVQQTPNGVDVSLRNLEYDLTSNIKKVVFGFQNVDAILASLTEPAEMQVFITPGTLPEWLAEAPTTIETVLQDIAGRSDGNFTYEFIDPTAPDSPITPQELFDTYGLQPLAVSLFSDQSYYLYMVLVAGDQAQIVYPQGEVSEAEVRTAVESALKRSSSGFLQVVGLWTPPAEPTQDMFGQMVQPISSWEQVRQTLQQEYEVQNVDLSTGSVPANIDVLVIVGPQNLDDVARYAIDQHLMRGGAVVVAAGNMMIMPDQMSGGLAAQQLEGGLQDMLTHYGFTVERSLVMDPQNEPFPVPVVRQVGDFQVQEIQALDYPMFVDVRPDGMAEESAITSGLAAVTLNWASPITIDAEKNAEREVEVLMTSTPQSWTQTEFNIQPNFELYPDTGFATVSATQPYTLAVAARGSFTSFFEGQPSPLEEAAVAEDAEAEGEEAPTPETAPSVGTIELSPPTSRLVVIGSTEFVDDIVLELSATLSGEKYLNNLQFLQNAVAWTMEDLDLLTIRSRGTAARVLIPMAENEQSFWEAANYVLALISVVAIAGVSTVRRRNEAPMELLPPEGTAARRRKVRETATEEVNA